jgi:hypothetical protein
MWNGPPSRSPRRNPYFQHAEAISSWPSAMGVPVGRISAQLDRLHLERHKDGAGQFGFLEAIDDAIGLRCPVDAAAAWLAKRGASSMRGPFSLSINDETGLLVDGFDRPPSVMMGHARPYYAARLEALGFTKAKDLIAYDYDAMPPLPKPWPPWWTRLETRRARNPPAVQAPSRPRPLHHHGHLQ